MLAIGRGLGAAKRGADALFSQGSQLASCLAFN